MAVFYLLLIEFGFYLGCDAILDENFEVGVKILRANQSISEKYVALRTKKRERENLVKGKGFS